MLQPCLSSPRPPSASQFATIDTGTSVIIAPQADAQAIYTAIPGSQLGANGLFTYPCSANPDVALSFAGQNFNIKAADSECMLHLKDLRASYEYHAVPSTLIDSADLLSAFIVSLGTDATNTTCTGAIVPSAQRNAWLVGDTYAIFPVLRLLSVLFAYLAR